MGRPSKYPEEFRREAVALALSTGQRHHPGTRLVTSDTARSPHTIGLLGKGPGWILAPSDPNLATVKQR
jgi:hypothetical protein